LTILPTPQIFSDDVHFNRDQAIRLGAVVVGELESDKADEVLGVGVGRIVRWPCVHVIDLMQEVL